MATNAGTIESGFSAEPAAASNPKIVLTRLGDAQTGMATQASAGINMQTIAQEGLIPAAAAGTTPKNMGSIPVSNGVIVPEASLLEVNMETVNNEFDAVIETPDINQVNPAPNGKIDFGAQPRNNGKIVE